MSEEINVNFDQIESAETVPEKRLRLITKDVTETENAKFSDFSLSMALLKSIYHAGFTFPSPIQVASIPVILQGHHVLARAKNGTGKTGAFAIPSIQLLDPAHPHPQAIVLLPSRELAIQTHAVFSKLMVHLREEPLLAIGGVPVQQNFAELAAGRRVVVGTIGRVQHLTEQRPALMGRVRLLIIDEADVMVGHRQIDLIRRIAGFLPAERQVLLFSATFPLEVKAFSDEFMPGARAVNTMERLTLRGVTPYYVYLNENEKLKCVWFLMRKLRINQSIIFVNTVPRCELLFRHMRDKGYSCDFIHSKIDQENRSSKFRHLVTTNLFTRGIDIPTVNVVVNFDFPASAETYLHRIGRSGRFGQIGLAVDMVTDDDKEDFFRIKRQLRLEIAILPEEIDHELYN